MAVWQPPEEAAPAPTSKVESIQAWIDSYEFVDNATASQDILKNVVGDLPDHQFTYGPTEGGGYTLEISGDTVTQTFVVKADE
jgi:hypothetical protein